MISNASSPFRQFLCLPTTVLTIGALLLLLSACSKETDSVSYDGYDLAMNIGLPQALTSPVIPELKAYVSLNGTKRTELSVNTLDNTVSGKISNVAEGTYTLKLVYYKIIALEEVQLAIFSKKITVRSGQSTNVSVASNDLDRNIDSDGDGYTNLAEVRLGTDPRLSSDVPGVPLGFSIAQGSFASATSTGFSLSSIVGESMVGENYSTNYQLVSGFTAY